MLPSLTDKNVSSPRGCAKVRAVDAFAIHTQLEHTVPSQMKPAFGLTLRASTMASKKPMGEHMSCMTPSYLISYAKQDLPRDRMFFVTCAPPAKYSTQSVSASGNLKKWSIARILQKAAGTPKDLRRKTSPSSNPVSGTVLSEMRRDGGS